MDNYFDSKERNATHQITPALHIIIFGELFSKCVMVLGNKAHEASITYSWVTHQYFRGGGELISVKWNAKHPIITHKYFGEFN